MTKLNPIPTYLKTGLLLLLYCISFSGWAYANNLSISDIALESPDADNETMKVKFDVSWDNSWRNMLNYDAAWVFVKYSTDSGTSWSHATIATAGTNPTGFSAGTGTSVVILVPSDKKGCFVQRANQGQGSLSVNDIRIVWAWGEDGLELGSSAMIKVIGVEMVYIPSGSFYVGDGNGSSESSYSFHRNGYNDTAVEISASSKLITCDINANDDIDTSPVSVDGDGGVTGNQNFPTGYRAFYAMKYEISENQWVDFFNTLTNSEKTNRDISSVSGKAADSVVNRNTFSWVSGDAATSNSDRACAYLSWMDLCAYADWAALRPMTELEFEKTARGTNSPVIGEYAWGNTAISPATTISGTEDGTETITDQNANCCYDDTTFIGGGGGKGPLRCGIFAGTSTSRAGAGAGFYGVMELSGNTMERTVTLGNSYGRAFSGTNGDGVLSSASSYEGNATNTDWPGIDDITERGVTGSDGSGLKGGSWNTVTAGLIAVSDRTYSSLSDSSRSSSYGGRCARTAP